MNKNIYIILLILVAVPAFADFYIVAKQSSYNAIPTSKKIKVRDELGKVIHAPVKIKLTWSLEKGSEIYGVAYFKKGAKQGISRLTPAQRQKLKTWLTANDIHVGTCADTDEFWALCASKGISRREI